MLQNVTSMIEFYLKQNMKVPSKESLDLELDPVLCRDEHGKRQFSKEGLPDWAKSFCEKIPLLLSQSLNVREGKLIHLVVIAQTNQEKEIPLVQVDFVPLDLHTFFFFFSLTYHLVLNFKAQMVRGGMKSKYPQLQVVRITRSSMGRNFANMLYGFTFTS